MENTKLISFIIGTRPEAIKLAPLIFAFQDCPLFKTRIILTGQHREMVKQIMDKFSLKADSNLSLMTEKQSLSRITSKIIENLEPEFNRYRPELVFVQGDTSSAFSAALLAFYKKIRLAHLEAGLRTNELFDPFPEEANRRLISQITSLHFAPTQRAFDNLQNSSINGKVFLTGNTVVDSLLFVSKNLPEFSLSGKNLTNRRLILITIHRRENWGDKINQICKAINELTILFKDCIFLIPMHKNPIVRDEIIRVLGKNNSVILKEPLDYDELISVIKSCHLILTDSGGIQEEAPTFKKPVLVLRDNTERLEAVEAGISKLIGTDTKAIVDQTTKVLTNRKEYNKMTSSNNPFGDGKASQRILKICIEEIFS